eukprot:scaffold858_cov123-Cylindrotheca_fusiformis.AAC.45
MVKVLPKIRGKRKKVQGVPVPPKDETSSSSFSKPAQKSLEIDIEEDERTAPLQETPSNTSGSSSRARSTKKEKPKLSKEEKLAAQKLAKERARTARAAAALDEKGNKLFERGYFDRAMLCYSKALKMKRRTFTSLLEDGDEIDKALSSKLSKGDCQVLVSMATSINNIGYLRQRSGEASAQETMTAYRKSLRIKRRILGNDSLSVGKTLNNIGSVYYLGRDFEGALKAYEEAMTIMKSNLGEEHPDIATVMSNMGDVYLANGQDDKTLEFYRLALNVRYANFGKHDPRVVRLLEKIAKIEIGDKMAPENEAETGTVDWEEHALTELGIKPLDVEYRILSGEVKADIEYFEEMEQQMCTNMVEDKVVLVRGMRRLREMESIESSTEEPAQGPDDEIEGSQVEIEDEDDVPEPSAEEESENVATRKAHLQALEHVHHRLKKIRSQRKLKDGTEGGSQDRDDEDCDSTGQSVCSTNSHDLYVSLYGQLEGNEKEIGSVASGSSDELFGQFYGPLETKPKSARLQSESFREGMDSQHKRVIVT